VKQLVVAQGGKIKVTSKVDQGSTFSFTLSFKKTKEKIASETQEADEPREQEKKGRILVVEDVALNQLLMKTLLEEFGYEMEIAGNGKIALDKLKDASYDLILMDLQMPEMNGFTATEQIRNTLKLKTPIIALTADVTTVDLEKCKAVGMDDYISKPIDDKLLYKKINKFLKAQPEGTETKPKSNNMKENDEGSEKITNLDFLRELTKNNPEMIAEMINVYLEETPQLLNRMKQSIRNKDFQGLRAAAHSIIPSFSTMGMDEKYTALAKTIQEQATKKEDLQGIQDNLSRLEKVCESAFKELKQDLVAL
jgi:CheY-like chemotaxis protein/HPt (histidine-containing phosphotransfer) domain-containing protein